jgi:hypothetical protein
MIARFNDIIAREVDVSTPHPYGDVKELCEEALNLLAQVEKPSVPLSKHEAMAEQLRTTLDELKDAKAKLAMTQTTLEDVWVWRSGEKNDLLGLTCPVVMAAEHCRKLVDRAELVTGTHALSTLTAGPLEMIMCCPACLNRHIDEGEWASRPHHTHACQHCGVCWRPAVGPTVGVQFLPGFKDAP